MLQNFWRINISRLLQILDNVWYSDLKNREINVFCATAAIGREEDQLGDSPEATTKTTTTTRQPGWGDGRGKETERAHRVAKYVLFSSS